MYCYYLNILTLICMLMLYAYIYYTDLKYKLSIFNLFIPSSELYFDEPLSAIILCNNGRSNRGNILVLKIMLNKTSFVTIINNFMVWPLKCEWEIPETVPWYQPLHHCHADPIDQTGSADPPGIVIELVAWWFRRFGASTSQRKWMMSKRKTWWTETLLNLE